MFGDVLASCQHIVGVESLQIVITAKSTECVGVAESLTMSSNSVAKEQRSSGPSEPVIYPGFAESSPPGQCG